MANIELILTPASPTGSMVFTLGAPGPQGIPGPQGPQGPQGEPGEGVIPGGSAGQALVKIDGTDYNTEWSSLTGFLTKAGNLSGLTDLATARDNLNLGVSNTAVFGGVDAGSGANVAHLSPTALSLTQSGHGQFTIQPSQGIVFPDATIQTTAYPGEPEGYLLAANNLSDVANSSTARDNLSLGQGNEVTFSGLITINGVSLNTLDAGGLNVSTNGGQPGESQIFVRSTGIQFPDSTIQTTAFPGASGFAPIYSPVFTGNPQAPTPATPDNDTSIATTAFVKAQGYITSAPVTSVAGRTGAVTLSNTDISGLGSLAVINDAPSNGSQYARENGAWSVVSAGGSYLPLAGGTMDEGAEIVIPYTSNDGEMRLGPTIGGGAFRVQVASISEPSSKSSLTFNSVGVENEDGYIQIYPGDIQLSDGAGIPASISAYTVRNTVLKTGATFTGKVNMAAPTAGGASLNLGVGTAPTTSVAGDIWIGTNINYKDSSGTQKAVANTNTLNTFTQPQVISTATSSTLPALRITNVSTTAASLVVEDTTNPDTTSLVVDISGNVGIGVPVGYTATQKVEVVGNVKADAFINGTGPTYKVNGIQSHSGGADTHELLISVNGSTYRVGMRFVSTP